MLSSSCSLSLLAVLVLFAFNDAVLNALVEIRLTYEPSPTFPTVKRGGRPEHAVRKVPAVQTPGVDRVDKTQIE